MCVCVCVVDPPSTVCVCYPKFQQDKPRTVVELPLRRFAYINNLYDIELGHKSHD